MDAAPERAWCVKGGDGNVMQKGVLQHACAKATLLLHSLNLALSLTFLTNPSARKSHSYWRLQTFRVRTFIANGCLVPPALHVYCDAYMCGQEQACAILRHRAERLRFALISSHDRA